MLDNPIYAALQTSHASFALTHGEAARFPNEVTALAGIAGDDASDFVHLLAPGESVGLFTGAPIRTEGLRITDEVALVQMVHEGTIEPLDAPFLDARDHADMLALATLTKPGPFGARTHELGAFVGTREHGTLVAMAGQRLRFPGHLEVSAICTHPDHLGRGHARRLTQAQLTLIEREGAVPFLHCRASNTRAIALYESLGFELRRTFTYVVVEREED